MSYQSLEIKDLYIKSLEEQNDTLLVAIYHLLNTINGYHSVTVKELNDYSMIEEESLREKIKIILKTNKPLDLFNTLLENSPKEDAKKYLLNLKEEFINTILSSPYNQSRFSGRRAKMFTKTTTENMNQIH